MSSIKPVRGNLRLLQEMNLDPDRKMAAGIVPERISAKGGDRILERRGVLADSEEIRLGALATTIQQRDAADRRAMFWGRAFFTLVCITGTASTALVLIWMRGGYSR